MRSGGRIERRTANRPPQSEPKLCGDDLDEMSPFLDASWRQLGPQTIRQSAPAAQY
jgi:hypothetical protein